MTEKTTVAIEQGSEAWHLIRRTKLSGTKIFDAIGLGGPRAMNDLYSYMAGLAPAKDLSCIPAVVWGKMNEDPAADWYKRSIVAGRTTFEPSPPWQVSKRCDWLGGSPDAFVGNDGILEIKCPWSVQDSWRSSLLKYYLQVQCYLQVTQRSWADLLFYRPFHIPPMGLVDHSGDPKVTMYRFPRSDRLWATVSTWCLEFMDHLNARKGPNIGYLLTKQERAKRRAFVKEIFEEESKVILTSSFAAPGPLALNS